MGLCHSNSIMSSTFEEIRLKFREAVLIALCDIHNIQYDSRHDSIDNLIDKLIKLERGLAFCTRKDTTRLLNLIPTVNEVTNQFNNMPKKRKTSNEVMTYTIILMLYSGYVLAEQTDDFIPDMTVVLNQVLGSKQAKEAYKHIIRIASSECKSCSKLRQFFLFGKDL